MVYLKSLYRRLDRLAQRQSSSFSTEAQKEHCKFYFQNVICFDQEDQTENYWVYIIHRHPYRPQK